MSDLNDCPTVNYPNGTIILRRKQVSAKTGLARSTIYDHMKRGNFPTPIRIGQKIVGWLEAEVEAWLADQVRKSRGEEK